MIGLATGLSLVCVIVAVLITVMIIHMRRKIAPQNKNVIIQEPSNGKIIFILLHAALSLYSCNDDMIELGKSNQ